MFGSHSHNPIKIKFRAMFNYNIYPLAITDNDFDESPDLVIMGVPFDSSTTYKSSTKFAPLLVRDASKNFREFNSRINTEINLSIVDVGDTEVVPGSVTKTSNIIESAIEDIHEFYDAPIGAIGGDHSITYGILRPMNLHNVTVVHIDAHPDLNNYIQGEAFNHGTVMRRVLELCPKQLIQIGQRAISQEEHQLVNETLRIQSYRNQIDEAITKLQQLKGDVYVSIDVDVLDPAFAPDVGNPVSCGLTPLELENIIYSLSSSNIIGFDVVEAGGLSIGNPTSVAAAKIIYDMIGVLQLKKGE